MPSPGPSAVDLVIGVDIGTTATKVVCFDAVVGEHGSSERGYPLLEPHPGQAVQDPQVVVGAVLEAIAAAVAAAAASGGGVVRGVSFSSAMHSLVGVDADGQPITPLVTWGDDRAVAQAESLRAAHPELHDRTGTPLHPMSPMVKIAWFRERQPDVFAQVRRWVGIKELVVERLTGQWVIDSSCASGTGLMSLEHLAWDSEALSVAGITPEQLSRIVPCSETLELRSDAIGLPLGTPIVVGGGDGPLANLGVGAVRPGVAACSIGTSGALRLMTDRASSDPERRLFCFALAPDRWAIGGAINNGGTVLEWTGSALAPDFGPHSEDRLLELAATVPPGSDGLVMLPYLLGERAPHWRAWPSGAYVGLRHFHGRPHLIRAAIEGVCLQLSLVLASLRDSGHEVRELRATGGFARSPFWRQMLTDAFGMPVGFPAEAQGSAFGAALVGMQAVGMVDSIDCAAELIELAETLEPDPQAAAIYADLLPLFAELYDDLTPAFRALAPSGTRDPSRERS